METKICFTCGQEQPVSNYLKTSFKNNKDGLNGNCKECHRAKRREYNHKVKYAHYKKYEKTENGFLMRLYRNMKSRITGVQKEKFHLYEGKPLLSKEAFYAWAKNDMRFRNLFEFYTQSGYDRKLAPSVDRVDSSKGYVLENMEWVTHSENSRRGSISKNGMRYETR